MSLTVAELARRLGGDVRGDATAALTRVAALSEAQPGDLSWITDARYAAELGACRASAVLAPPQLAVRAAAPLILVADVEAALCDALALLGAPAPVVPAGVHATACVDPTARVAGAAVGPHVVIGPRASVGPGTQLHAGVYVGEDATIGRDCVLWPNVVVRERVTLGDRVIIHGNSTIGADGFGYIFRDGAHRKVPQVGTVVIADDVEIGANCGIDRAKCGVTRIGRGTKIDNLVQVGHNVVIGEHCIVVAQCGLSGSVRLGRGVVLGGQVGVADHADVGDGVVAQAKSGIKGDVPAGRVVRGVPAVESAAWLRQNAALQRLAGLFEQFRALRRRVEQLERGTTKDDSARH